MNKRLIDSELKEMLKALNFDIKAESFFSYFSDSNATIQYEFQDFFTRGYSNDIVDIKVAEDDNSNVHYAFLSRLNFYDIFPEIFFHNNEGSPGVKNMVSNYKKRKKEEKYARKFFQPIENELFNFSLDVEKHEQEVISSLGEREFLMILNKIWDIDRSLPYKEMVKVIKFLPFMHKISGDVEAITYILEHVFNITIEVTEEPIIIENKLNNHKTELLLGNTFALEAPKTTYLKKYIFTLVDVKDITNIHEYFSDGKVNKILSLFLNYTMPLESEFEIRFLIPKEEQLFVLDDQPHTGRINISTTLA
jgi:hypothetical protein